MKTGDKIRVNTYFGNTPIAQQDYIVEEFRYCLGIFETQQDREAGAFTPLCRLYEVGSESEKKYISNYGEYHTNMVQSWMDLP